MILKLVKVLCEYKSTDYKLASYFFFHFIWKYLISICDHIVWPIVIYDYFKS